jgi:hypothetical protein
MAALESTIFITIKLTNQNKNLNETMPIKYQASTRNRQDQHNTTQHNTTQNNPRLGQDGKQ